MNVGFEIGKIKSVLLIVIRWFIKYCCYLSIRRYRFGKKKENKNIFFKI